MSDADDLVIADTQILVYLSSASEWSTGYERLIGERKVVLPFQVRAELGGYPESRGWGSRRQEALALLIRECAELPHSPSSNTWYARVNEKRRELHNTSGDGDVWIVAQALEYGLPLISHNEHLIDLARSMGVQAETLLPSRI